MGPPCFETVKLSELKSLSLNLGTLEQLLVILMFRIPRIQSLEYSGPFESAAWML